METQSISVFSYFWRLQNGRSPAFVCSTLSFSKASMHSFPDQVLLPALFTTILDSSLNSLIVYEPVRQSALGDSPGEIVDFIIRLVNKAATELTGLAEADLRNHSLRDLFPALATGEPFERYKQACLTGQRDRFEGHFSHHYNQQPRWFDVSVVPVSDQLVVSCVDISEAKEQSLAQEQARQQLAQTAQMLQNILDSTHAGMALYRSIRETGPDGQTGAIIDFEFLAVNQMAIRMTGRPEADLIGSRLLTQFPYSIESGVFAHYVAAVETGQLQRFEVEYRADGMEGWYSVAVVKQDDGFIETFLDITTTKQAELAQQQARTRLQAIMDNAQSGMFLFRPVFDADGAMTDFVFTMTNKALAEYVGQEPTQLLNGLGSTWFPAYQTNGLFSRYRYTWETGETQRFEFYYDADGIDSWLDIRSAPFEDEVLITFLDVTLLKRVQLGQQQQTELLNSVLDGSSNGVLAFTARRDANQQITDLNIVAANQAAETITGTPVSALMGSTLLTHFPGNVASGLFAKYVNTIETGEPTRLETYYQYDGLDFWLDISARKLGDGVVITFTDVSALKRIQRKLETLVDALRESNEGLEQFAYVASHDLQEPLRKVQSFGEMLQTQYATELGEAGILLLGRMQAATIRMQTLIQDLLAYSRLATQPGTVAPVDLNRIITEVLGDLEMVSQAKNAVIEVDDLPKIAGDTLQFRQLFQNLLSNALKFTHPATTGIQPYITIRCRLVMGQAANLEVGLHPDASYYEISVADNGIGFEEKYRDRIFGAFQRLHGRSQYPGTGVGLAIVKKVMDKHGGHIVARSRPGVGSTFTLYFPQLV